MILQTEGTLTANERVLRAAIRHAVLMERMKSSEVDALVSMLNKDVLPDLIARLRWMLDRVNLRGIDADALKTQRYRDMIASINGIVDEGMRSVHLAHVDRLIEVAKYEAEWQRGAIVRAAPVKVSLDLPSVSTMRSIVTSRPFEGHILKDWWGGLAESTKTKVQAQINAGLALSEDTDAIVRRLRGTAEARFADGALQTTRRNAESIVRTATQHVSAHSREELYRENEDVIDGVQIVATLDTRTTPVCRSQDGKVYKAGEGPRPPFHWGCRTTTAPVLKSWKQLGLKFKELDEGTRASMNGQVPASMTYYEWLAEQPAGVQDQALGPARGRLFRSGKVAPEKLTDSRGRALTLKELAAIEAA